MEVGETLVALFGILCGTGLMGGAIWGCVEVARAFALRGPRVANAELQALRQEVRQLREQNADLVLTVDTTLQRLTAIAGALPAPSKEEEKQLTGVGR